MEPAPRSGYTPIQRCQCDPCPQSNAADNLASELASGLGIPTSAGELLIASVGLGNVSSTPTPTDNKRGLIAAIAIGALVLLW